MAAVGGLVAILMVLRENYDYAFVAAAAGAVCWFLSYRQQLRATLPKEDEVIEDDEDEEVRS